MRWNSVFREIVSQNGPSSELDSTDDGEKATTIGGALLMLFFPKLVE